MENNLDTVFAAMADPTRRDVLMRLSNGPATVSELHEGHDIALPSFMKHLSKLEAAGLVNSEKTGRVRTVELDAAALTVAEKWIHKQRRQWEGRLDRLQALAETLHRTKS